ncbi:MAG: hypothetical protein R3C01_05840 [Planctomycetaceae bacterium]
MHDFEIGIEYIGGISEEYFSEFADGVESGGATLLSKPRENVYYAALEWVVPTAIAVYIGKPFVDGILKRAANDFGDTVYPKIKDAVKQLVRKVFVGQPLSFTTVTSSSAKLTSVESTIFSVCAFGPDGTKMKFIFNERLNEAEYNACIDALFRQLVDFHRSDSPDAITEQLEQLPIQRRRSIYLIYGATLESWSVVDPIAASLARQSQRKAEDEAS